jgi:hypothetical protein
LNFFLDPSPEVEKIERLIFIDRVEVAVRSWFFAILGLKRDKQIIFGTQVAIAGMDTYRPDIVDYCLSLLAAQFGLNSLRFRRYSTCRTMLDWIQVQSNIALLTEILSQELNTFL